MRQYFYLFVIALLSTLIFGCKKSSNQDIIPKESPTSIRHLADSGDDDGQNYDYEGLPYTYMMNKYLNICLEYLYDIDDWDESYPELTIEDKQSIINNYVSENEYLEDVALESTDFDVFFNQLYYEMIDELNTYPEVSFRIQEGMDISHGGIEDIDGNDMMVSIGGQVYSKFEILQKQEDSSPYLHEQYNIEEGDQDCGCNPTPNASGAQPRRLVRYMLISKWLTDIRYRNYNNTCQCMDNLVDAMRTWEEAANHAIHFREIADNGWNRFTWGIGCNYHVRLSNETDEHCAGSAKIGAVPWSSCLLSNNASVGTCLHELGHILSLEHEQSRSDRDCYITINEDNILPGYESNFHRYLPTSVSDFGEFDFESIMLYGSYSFPIHQSQPTMTKKDGTTFSANRSYLSTNDIRYIQSIYN